MFIQPAAKPHDSPQFQAFDLVRHIHRLSTPAEAGNVEPNKTLFDAVQAAPLELQTAFHDSISQALYSGSITPNQAARLNSIPWGGKTNRTFDQWQEKDAARPRGIGEAVLGELLPSVRLAKSERDLALALSTVPDLNQISHNDAAVIQNEVSKNERLSSNEKYHRLEGLFWSLFYHAGALFNSYTEHLKEAVEKLVPKTADAQ